MKRKPEGSGGRQFRVRMTDAERQRSDYFAQLEAGRRTEAKRKSDFDMLASRHRDVMQGVSGLTVSAPLVNWGGTNRRKVTVVLGEAEFSKDAPDRVIVSGVTYIDYGHNHHERGGNSVTVQTARFDFAKVPRHKVDHFVADPHDLGNTDHLDVEQLGGYETISANRIDQDKITWRGASRGAHRRAVRIVEDEVFVAESYLEQVAGAAQNPVLNPHLQTAPTEV